MVKVVFLGHEPLSKSNISNFYIRELIEMGFDIEYVDLSAVVHHGMILPDKVEDVAQTRLDTVDAFRDFISKNVGTPRIYVVELYEKWSARHLFKILNEYHCRCIRIDVFSHAPSPTDLRKVLLYLGHPTYLVKSLAGYVVRMRLHRFYKRAGISRKYEYVLNPKNRPGAADAVRINSLDYEAFVRKSGHEERLVEGPYCLFLDDYLTNHPDIKHLLNSKPVDADTYFMLMNRFFGLVEKKTGIPVVVAAHPKSMYTEGAFGNRRIIKYRTGELTRFAEFVIAHSSLSVHFAVLNYKPILFTSMKGLQRILLGSYLVMCYRAFLLGQPVYNLDRVEDIEIVPVERDKYDSYKYEYLVGRDTGNRWNKDIVAEVLQIMAVQDNTSDGKRNLN